MFNNKLFHKQLIREDIVEEEISYETLTNLPHINNVPLLGYKTSKDLDLVSVADLTNLENLLGGKIDTLQGDMTELEGKLGTVENNIGNVQGNVAELDNKLVSVQEDLTRVDNNVSTVEGNVSNLTVDLNTLEASKGVANGLATLGADSKLTSTQVPAIHLVKLEDLNLANLADKDILVYDSSTSKWVNTDRETLKSTGAIVLGDNAKVSAEHAGQLGAGSNTEDMTLNFLGWRLINADGTIPSARLRNASVPDWAHSEVKLNDTEYTAEADGTLYIQCNLGSWCYFIVNGYQYPIGGSSGGHMFDFRIGKGDVWKYQAGTTDSLRLLWVPDKGQ